jgi:hypothetical protein
MLQNYQCGQERNPHLRGGQHGVDGGDRLVDLA